MKKILIFIFLIVQQLGLSAQEYKQAVGIRAGLTPGFEYRIFTDNANSYKLLLSSRNNGIQLHGLKEFHTYNLFSFSDQMVFVYGFGLHAGYIQYDKKWLYYNTHYYEKTTAIICGLDGMAGVEYNFQGLPISLGFEVKPFFDLFGEQPFHIQPFDFAFTIKYLF